MRIPLLGMVAALAAIAPNVAGAVAQRPVPLNAQVERSASWMRTLGIPVPVTARVEVVPDEYGLQAVTTMGTTIFTPGFMADAWRYGEFGDVLIHELVHTASPYLSTQRTAIDRAAEEGIAAQLAVDLWPAWRFRFAPRGIEFGEPLGESPTAYRRARAWVRRASATATGAHWNSPAARIWRRQLVAGDRRAMLRGAPLPPAWRG